MSKSMFKLKVKSSNRLIVISTFTLIALVLACLVSLGARRTEATQIIKQTLNPDYYPHIQKVVLEGGLTCNIIPGTAGTLSNGDWYFYTCGNDKTVILGPLDQEFDKTKALWKVKVVTLGKDWEEVGEVKTLKVFKVWQ